MIPPPRVPAVPRSADPSTFAQSVASTLSAWDTALGLKPLDYTSAILGVGDPSGDEQAGLVSDVAAYLPTRDASIELRQYATRQHITIGAVSYLRVSTREQAEKGGTDEGFSIPAQCEATRHKDEQLGAGIVEKFVDAGASAKSSDRPELMLMIQYVKANKVAYCIVHKVDRLARNRADDVSIHLALQQCGVMLVSASENIDETPSGMLLHGIMSSVAEFYSRNLPPEVTKGITQKVANGGTLSRAPIGYLNVHKRDAQGREYRTVEVDPDRAPLICWVFDTYAKGEHTVPGLLAEATARGLTTVPTPKRPSGPVGRSTFFKLLRNPYYIGQVRYQGAQHPGAHEPIVVPETWQQVQALLDTRATAGERRRKHKHYLKGTLYCGTCTSRLQLDYARNKQDIRYAYYICTGRAIRTTTCTRKAVPVGVAEQLVIDCYQQIAISSSTYAQLAERVESAFDERLAEWSQTIDDLTTTKQRLEAEADKLLEAHFADAIDLLTLKRHQDRIRIALADVTKWLESERHDHEGPRQHIATALRLFADCATMYERNDDLGKRIANQAFYQRILITEDEKAAIQLNEPFAALAPTSTYVRCSSTSNLVDVKGLEPLTFRV
ncbi:recombinase family protein [Austwickia sp. TVS 96-490-7B]|uniref:recombinase family protein n=1 Tax=Austwickia sp. TVS 96-490-7B TaxID=2830843 RepID=UPI00351D5A45